MMTRPFLKWVGGKRRLVDEIHEALAPVSGAARAYFEPFVGGGAVFFSRPWPNPVIGDVNKELTGTYRVVRDNPRALVALLNALQVIHQDDPDYYYEMRAIDPATLEPVERAARMVYLNKTCFNGLYRVNKQGKFNVPRGSYANPRISNRDSIMAASEMLQGVSIVHGPCQVTCADVSPGAIVYMDPPYAPVSRTSSFKEYSRDGFSWSDQEQLAEFALALRNRGANVIVSNSPPVKSLYESRGFVIREVGAARSVNCRANKRGPVKEILALGLQT